MRSPKIRGIRRYSVGMSVHLDDDLSLCHCTPRIHSSSSPQDINCRGEEFVKPRFVDRDDNVEWVFLRGESKKERKNTVSTPVIQISSTFSSFSSREESTKERTLSPHLLFKFLQCFLLSLLEENR